MVVDESRFKDGMCNFPIANQRAAGASEEGEEPSPTISRVGTPTGLATQHGTGKGSQV